MVSTEAASEQLKKHYDTAFGSLILEKQPFILSPKDPRYVKLRDRAERKGFHIRGIKIEVIK